MQNLGCLIQVICCETNKQNAVIIVKVIIITIHDTSHCRQIDGIHGLRYGTKISTVLYTLVASLNVPFITVD